MDMSASWVVFALAFCLNGAQFLETGTQKGHVSELAAVNLTLPAVNFTLDIPCLLGLVKPCGNVSLPANFTTPLGSISVPGEKALESEVGGADKAFQAYTVFFVGGFGGLFVLWTAASRSRRQALVAKVKRTLTGELHEEDPHMTEEEKKKEEEEKHDPSSEHFIAPCEIYRFMAVMHPGIVGYTAYSSNAFQAGICAYMQLYLPVNIFLSTLDKWDFYGIKSPFWWVFNLFAFATKIAALGNVVNLFVSKNTLMLKETAEAAWFLLTHDEPEPEPEEPTDAKEAPSNAVSPSEPLLDKQQAEKQVEAAKEKAEAAKEEAEKEANALAKGDLSSVANLIPQPPEWVINLNEKAWVIIGMTVNIIMSFGLVACMYIKVATFSGDMADIAIVTVALYFVSDLDKKVLEANPKMKKLYGKKVLAQTVVNDEKPVWIKKVIGVAVHFLEMSVSLGIAFICLFAWKGLDAHGQDIIIGGDPFAAVKSV